MYSGTDFNNNERDNFVFCKRCNMYIRLFSQDKNSVIQCYKCGSILSNTKLYHNVDILL